MKTSEDTTAPVNLCAHGLTACDNAVLYRVTQDATVNFVHYCEEAAEIDRANGYEVTSMPGPEEES